MSEQPPARSSRTRNLIQVLAVFLLIMAACYGYLRPKLAETQQLTMAAQDATRGIREQINDISARKQRESVDRSRYEALEKTGFLGDQNRLNAARILENMRVRHRVTGMEYQIDAVESIPVTRQQDNAGLIIRNSKIDMTLHGFLDSDMIDFSEAAQRSLPGHVTLKEIFIEKLADPTQDQLMAISRGGGIDLVRATLVLQWRVAQTPAQAAGVQ
jgi:hypothetical protein